MAAGATLALGSAATAPVFFVSVPSGAAATYNLVSGYASVRRGAQQFSESLNDASGPSLQNLWGLAPSGQAYDDPGEPNGPVEYARGVRAEYRADPAAAMRRAIRDYFAY
jgi:hypothetical protein